MLESARPTLRILSSMFMAAATPPPERLRCGLVRKQRCIASETLWLGGCCRWCWCELRAGRGRRHVVLLRRLRNTEV